MVVDERNAKSGTGARSSSQEIAAPKHPRRWFMRRSRLSIMFSPRNPFFEKAGYPAENICLEMVLLIRTADGTRLKIFFISSAPTNNSTYESR